MINLSCGLYLIKGASIEVLYHDSIQYLVKYIHMTTYSSSTCANSPRCHHPYPRASKCLELISPGINRQATRDTNDARLSISVDVGPEHCRSELDIGQ